MTYRNKKILRHARGQDCQMQIPGHCNGNHETVVAAHSGLLEDNKGCGHKADDFCIAYMCSSCHDVYDRRTYTNISKNDLLAMFHTAMKRTLRILFNDGVIK